MQQAESRRPEFTPEEGWRTVHETLAQSQSSLYLAGTAYILLLWGAIVSAYFFTLFAIAELAPGFEASYPWYRGPLWVVIGASGMVGSALIGRIAKGSRNADHATDTKSRAQGVRVLDGSGYCGISNPWRGWVVVSRCGREHTSCRHRNCVPRLRAVRHNAPPSPGCWLEWGWRRRSTCPLI